MLLRIAVAMSAVLLAACSRSGEPKKDEQPAAARPEAAQNVFNVRFDTSQGPFTIEVHRDWAPLGAERFEALVKDRFYNGARFFRVVPNFVIQFGIPADPRMHKKWNKPIKDDDPVQTNRYKSVAFATSGPESRTTQVFINLRSNQTLDKQGFVPFGIVTEGMEVVEKLYAGYGERPVQSKIERQGNTYLVANFPKLDYIRTAQIR
ncbi:MAG TPA: peptidylprolyl isomerase [Bryobacteraceae bacterium]|nr:peptidylprolyl isomerase [Bryobacteraceae bacterium]